MRSKTWSRRLLVQSKQTRGKGAWAKLCWTKQWAERSTNEESWREDQGSGEERESFFVLPCAFGSLFWVGAEWRQARKEPLLETLCSVCMWCWVATKCVGCKEMQNLSATMCATRSSPFKHTNREVWKVKGAKRQHILVVMSWRARWWRVAYCNRDFALAIMCMHANRDGDMRLTAWCDNHAILGVRPSFKG